MRPVVVIGLFIALMAVRPHESRAQTQSVPSDFAFRFEFGTCTTDRMDTFDNIFTHDVNSNQGRATSVSPVLPSASMRAVFEALGEARFFEYPPVFHVDSDSLKIPSDHYRLEVRSGGVRHTVSWSDDAGGSTTQADRLRSLFKKLESVVYERPEWKQRFFGVLVVCA